MGELLFKMAGLLFGVGEVESVHYVRREDAPNGIVGRGWTVKFSNHPVRLVVGQNGKEAAMNLARRFADVLTSDDMTIGEARLLALRAVLAVA